MLFSIHRYAKVSSSDPGRIRGEAHLSPLLLRDLQSKMGIAFSRIDNSDDTTGRIVPMTILTKSSPRHVDHYAPSGGGAKGKQRRPTNEDRVAFVVLNTNPDAYFSYADNVSVPIVEGSLVHFSGGVPHNTIVNSGFVQLLGPFDAMGFASVGTFFSCGPYASPPTPCSECVFEITDETRLFGPNADAFTACYLATPLPLLASGFLLAAPSLRPEADFGCLVCSDTYTSPFGPGIGNMPEFAQQLVASATNSTNSELLGDSGPGGVRARGLSRTNKSVRGLKKAKGGGGTKDGGKGGNPTAGFRCVGAEEAFRTGQLCIPPLPVPPFLYVGAYCANGFCDPPMRG
jgi:hypothetical protein